MNDLHLEFASPLWCLGPNLEFKGYYIESMTLNPAHTEQTVWDLERASLGRWLLTTWLEKDGIEPRRTERPVDVARPGVVDRQPELIEVDAEAVAVDIGGGLQDAFGQARDLAEIEAAQV